MSNLPFNERCNHAYTLIEECGLFPEYDVFDDFAVFYFNSIEDFDKFECIISAFERAGLRITGLSGACDFDCTPWISVRVELAGV